MLMSVTARTWLREINEASEKELRLQTSTVLNDMAMRDLTSAQSPRHDSADRRGISPIKPVRHRHVLIYVTLITSNVINDRHGHQTGMPAYSWLNN